jgi:hypothetical protein
VELCKECIEWAKSENRTFLRQALEARLIALYFDTAAYSEALQLGMYMAVRHRWLKLMHMHFFDMLEAENDNLSHLTF